MGNKQLQVEVPKLRRSELEEFSKQSLLIPMIVEQLYRHFYRISSSKIEDGVIDLSEFCLSIKKKENSLISERIFSMFDANNDGVINFREFLLGISVFSDCQDIMLKENTHMAAIRIKDKIEYSLRIVNIKKNNRIYVEDVVNILTSVIEEKNLIKLDTKQIKSIVKNTFKTEKVQKDQHGKYWDQISYSKMISKNQKVFKWLAVDIERLKQQIKRKRNAKKCTSL
jgi:Ca2+-binding EF-hand superfamily protein